MGLWDAVASAGSYTNSRHLAPDRKPHQHLITQFLQAECSSWRPTNSVKALKAVSLTVIYSSILILLHAAHMDPIESVLFFV